VVRFLDLCAVFVASAVACSNGVTESGPKSVARDSSSSGDGSTFQRATLTVTAHVESSDSALAAAVGSPTGLLRNALVTLQRQGRTGSVSTDSTDAVGTARFADLVPGSYVITVVRLLTSAEIAGFRSADADVNAFGGGLVVEVGAPTTAATVEVAAGRRGSLVISELFAYSPKFGPLGISEYRFGMFIELYNNSDTTIYLDGTIIGEGLAWFRWYHEAIDCVHMEKWRNDPDGIWAINFDAFPGTGQDHPLAPGGATVVATDAIDHRAVLAGFLDLSGADFEMHGSNDVDNPGVPNMIDVGVQEPGATVDGHGLWFRGEGATFLASPVDVTTLPRDSLPVSSPWYVRMPRDAILDVYSTSETPAGEAASSALGYPLCPQIVNSVFDRQYANLYDRQVALSMRRKVFATLPDGRVILLRTRSSANDFVLEAPTPGKVP
jgi:hypothetical protein